MDAVRVPGTPSHPAALKAAFSVPVILLPEGTKFMDEQQRFCLVYDAFVKSKPSASRCEFILAYSSGSQTRLHHLSQNLWEIGSRYQYFLKAPNESTMLLGLPITVYSVAVNGFPLRATASEASPPVDSSLDHPEQSFRGLLLSNGESGTKWHAPHFAHSHHLLLVSFSFK